MKKIILFVLLSFTSLITYAQDSPVFGLKAGLNLSELSRTAGALYSTQLLPGYNFGGVLNIAVDNDLSLQPGFLISTKGGRNTYSLDRFYGTAKVTLTYIEIPLNLLYQVPAGKGKVFFGGGPYLGYGLSSNTDYTGDGAAGGQTQFGDGIYDLKRVDLGINIMVGYKLKNGIAADIDYGLGLADLRNTGNSSAAKNKVIGISLVYFFKN